MSLHLLLNGNEGADELVKLSKGEIRLLSWSVFFSSVVLCIYLVPTSYPALQLVGTVLLLLCPSKPGIPKNSSYLVQA